MVARASRADLPKTLWEQERRGEGQRDSIRAGGNEGGGGVWPWLGVGLAWECQGLGAGMGWYPGQKIGHLEG